MEAKATNHDGMEQNDENDETALTRRQFGQAAAVTAVAIGAGAGNVSAASIDDSATVDFSHQYAHDPYLEGTVTVARHKSDFGQLDYVADDETRTSLTEDGIVLASQVDSDTPHNPVTLTASKFVTPEYTAFPRDVKYDSDGDGDVDSDDDGVSWKESSHWTTTNSTNGTISLTEGGDGRSMTVASSTVPSGETVKATFDLSTVGSTDATITDGMSRKFLQTVMDVNTLESGTTFTIAVQDSAGTEVTAKVQPGADTSLVDVLTASTGSSKVREARVGELESAQSVTLDDIQKVQIRISDADASITFHGFNLERAENWSFGTEEYTNSDGNVDTRDVVEPTGSFTITGLSTLPTFFSNAEIQDVKYDVEQRTSHLPEDRLHVRVKDSPSAYDRPKAVEYVPEFEWPTAYALDVTSGAAKMDVLLPGGRYIAGEVATGIADVDEWKDVEDNISWTDKTGSFGSVGSTVTLLSSTAVGDRTAVHIVTTHEEKEATALTSTGSSSSSNNVAVVGEGGGFFDPVKTVLLGLFGALAFWKRKAIMGLRG